MVMMIMTTIVITAAFVLTVITMTTHRPNVVMAMMVTAMTENCDDNRCGSDDAGDLRTGVCDCKCDDNNLDTRVHVYK